MGWQMLTGTAYLHHYCFSHRDIKPENYLLDRSGISLKLTDFGLARSFAPGEKMTTRAGSLLYAAPEVLDSDVDGYGAKCDIWSIGVTLWFASVGEWPFHGSEENLSKNIVKGRYKLKADLWEGLHGHPKELQDLMVELLVREPENRPSAR